MKPFIIGLKYFLELYYTNKYLIKFFFRFTNDLFFWSPSFPTPASRDGGSNKLSHILDGTRYFVPCKSGIQFGKFKTSF